MKRTVIPSMARLPFIQSCNVHVRFIQALLDGKELSNGTTFIKNNARSITTGSPVWYTVFVIGLESSREYKRQNLVVIPAEQDCRHVLWVGTVLLSFCLSTTGSFGIEEVLYIHFMQVTKLYKESTRA